MPPNATGHAAIDGTAGAVWRRRLASNRAFCYRLVAMRTLYTWLIPAIWSVWALYWFVAALAAKPVRRREGLASRLSHIIPLLLAVLLVMSPRLGGTALGAHFLPSSAVQFWIGVVLLCAGLLFAVAARHRLGGNWSGSVTLKQGHTLTRDGPYRFVRHPIYSGILLAFFGSAVIALGEWRGLLALVLLTAAFLRKIRIEERFMLEQFGDDYARYRKEVAALVPGVL
jgi:protein-S-isoprenylcysteine O-methyltransferase Ste14